MKVLITGASGFVGTHLCKKLLEEGHEVFALVRTPSKFSEVAPHPRLKMIQGDLDQEFSWISLLPSELDSVVHTAGIVHSYNTDQFFQTNAVGTLKLSEALKTKYSTLHFVLISSLAAAGPSMGPRKRNEDDLDAPVSVYGRSKKKAEEHLKESAPQDWSISIIRPPMIIGPRDSAVLDIFKMVKGKAILLPGKGSLLKMYSFVCVFDLIDTIVKILNQKKNGMFYSAHPQTVSFSELILEIKNQLGVPFIYHLPMPLFLIKGLAMLLNFLNKVFPHQLRLTPDKVFELEATNWTCAGEKASLELGQQYEFDLEKTIAVTLEDYRQRKWI